MQARACSGWWGVDRPAALRAAIGMAFSLALSLGSELSAGEAGVGLSAPALPDVSTAPKQAASLAEAGGLDHSVWDGVLSRIVRPEGVDYLEARARHLPAIANYLEGLCRVRVGALGRDERLAYWLNLHNATLVGAVAQRFYDGYRVDERDHVLLDERTVWTPVRLYSLKEVRALACSPEFVEPRAFIGLSLAARAGPALAARAYRGDTVRQALLDRTAQYVQATTRFAEFNGRERLQLSPVLDWNQAAFGGLGDVLTEVARHHGGDLSRRRYEFVRFDWALDLAPPARGRWVRVIEGRAELRRSPDGPAQGWVGRQRVLECVEEAPGFVKVLVPPRHEALWLPREAVGPWPRGAREGLVVGEAPGSSTQDE